MFERWRSAVRSVPAGIRPASYALAAGVQALQVDPARRRRWLAGGGTLLALAAGAAGFGLGRLSRAEPAAIESARTAAFLDDLQLQARAAQVLAVAPRVPDDVEVATALDRLARHALADRGAEGALLARRLLVALHAGARALAPHRAALEARVRGS